MGNRVKMGLDTRLRLAFACDHLNAKRKHPTHCTVTVKDLVTVVAPSLTVTCMT
jgi:hypothetical protein